MINGVQHSFVETERVLKEDFTFASHTSVKKTFRELIPVFIIIAEERSEITNTKKIRDLRKPVPCIKYLGKWKINISALKTLIGMWWRYSVNLRKQDKLRNHKL